MKNFVQNGCNVTVTVPYAVTSGDGVLVGGMFGVAVTSALINGTTEIATEGVFDFPKTTGASTNWAQGGLVYWNNTARQVTGVSSGNTLIGYGMFITAVGATVGRVRLAI